MSLYTEAAAAIENAEKIGGSLKSRIYANKNSKNQASQLYALAIEAIKWSPILKEVIDKSQILDHEKKVRLISLPVMLLNLILMWISSLIHYWPHFWFTIYYLPGEELLLPGLIYFKSQSRDIKLD
jgi:hypothetical protein